MIHSDINYNNKASEHLHQAIRKKHKDQIFKILRQELLNITPQQAMNMATEKMKELQSLINYKCFEDKLWQERIRNLLKSLKELSCCGLAAQALCNPLNIKLFLHLQNQFSCSTGSQTYTVNFLHIILLNISGSQSKQNRMRFQAEDLSFKYLETQLYNTIQYLLYICYNLVLQDKSSKTIYFLVSSQKIGLYKKLLQIFCNYPHIYQTFESCILGLARVLLTSTCRYKFSKNCQEDYVQFSKHLYKKIETNFLKITFQNNVAQHQTLKNQYLRTLKVLLRTQNVEFSSQLINALENKRTFNPSNNYLIQLLASLAFYSCYSLGQDHIKLLLQHLLQYIQFEPFSILRLLSNSLINDSSHWKLVYQFLINQATCTSLGQILDFQRFPNTALFVYFLRDPRVQYDICEIIGIIVYQQGGFGILQECVEQMARSHHGVEKLRKFGFQI